MTLQINKLPKRSRQEKKGERINALRSALELDQPAEAKSKTTSMRPALERSKATSAKPAAKPAASKPSGARSYMPPAKAAHRYADSRIIIFRTINVLKYLTGILRQIVVRLSSVR